ncbi:MAG TPA: tRNA pseudouridine(13) synthase TruD [Trueperaceae bacterium]|nr:tRNA pseudouridine(13) synthase TruD [Trueperaceae bacterium]
MTTDQLDDVPDENVTTEQPDDPQIQQRADLLFDWDRLPLVSQDLPGTGGVIRVEPDDFFVEEIPAYLPSGAGAHTYLKVQKRGHTTRDVVLALMGAGVAEKRIGVAGLKDKSAVTVQWLSLPATEEAAMAALAELPGVTVLETSRHTNKLGMGHLRGNRFTIRVRGVAPDAASRARAIVEHLAVMGAPNWFGPQRFGRFGANAWDGWRIVTGESVPGAHRLKRFFVSSLQSLLFNRLLAQRLETGSYARVIDGDWARKHDTGGTFLVADGAAESPRAERLEISATIPLYGRKVKVSPGAAGDHESAALDGLGLSWQHFTSRRGDRRITRLALANVEVTQSGHDLTLAFALPKGSYATALLREIMKVDVDKPTVWTAADPASVSAVEHDEVHDDDDLE